MKKLLRTFFLTLLAAVMMLGVVGCGSSSSDYEEVAGTYEMMSASGTVNGTTVTKDSFAYFRLILDLKGNATLQYKISGNAGAENETKGTYTYNEGTVRMVTGRGSTRTVDEYQYSDGVIIYSLERGQSNKDLGPTKYAVRLRRIDDEFMRQLVGTYEMTSINGKMFGIQIKKDLFKYYRLILDEKGNATEQVNLAGIGEMSVPDSKATYVYENGKIKVTYEIGSVSETDVYDYVDGILTISVKEKNMEFTVVLEKTSDSTEIIPDNPNDETPVDQDFIRQVLIGSYDLTYFSGHIYGITLTVEDFKYYRINIDADGYFIVRVKLNDDVEGLQASDSGGIYTYENGIITVTKLNDEYEEYTEEYYYSVGVITYIVVTEDSQYTMVFEKVVK